MRKAVRTVVTFFHYVVLPTVSVIMMWLIYHKKEKTKNEAQKSRNCLKNCVFACNVFRQTDDLEQVEIPEISIDCAESVQKPQRDRNSTETGEKSVQSPANQRYCNFGYYGLILLNIVIPILFIVSGLIFIISGISHSIDDWHKKSTVNFTKWDIRRDNAYSICAPIFYSFNYFLIPPMLIYTINVYLNVMYRSAWLERLLMKNAQSDRRKAIIKRILKFFQLPDYELERKLTCVNIFSSIYTLDVVLFDGAYILYLYIKNLFHDWWRWSTIICFGASGFLLLFVMVITNYHIENLKKSTLLLPIIGRISESKDSTKENHSADQTEPQSSHVTKQNKHFSDFDNVASIQTMLNSFNPYAAVFGYASHLRTLLIMIVVQVITYLAPYILKTHGIIKPEKLTHLHLEMF